MFRICFLVVPTLFIKIAFLFYIFVVLFTCNKRYKKTVTDEFSCKAAYWSNNPLKRNKKYIFILLCNNSAGRQKRFWINLTYIIIKYMIISFRLHFYFTTILFIYSSAFIFLSCSFFTLINNGLNWKWKTPMEYQT